MSLSSKHPPALKTPSRSTLPQIYYYPRHLYSFRNLSEILASKPSKTFEQEIDALNGHYIWFSNFRSKNDPMEGIFNHSTDHISDAIVYAISNVNFSSFSSTINSQPMWSHYSNNKLLCLKFNTKKLFNSLEISNSEFKVISPIVYVDEIFDYDKEYPEGYYVENDTNEALRLLTQKHRQWSYENEWRIFCSRKKKVHYANDALEQIIFGTNADSKEIRAFRKKMNDSCSLKQVSFTKSGFELQDAPS